MLSYGSKLTVDIRESSTETAKAVPQAKGCVRYNSVSGSSSSSWSKNWTLLSLTSSEKYKRYLDDLPYQLTTMFLQHTCYHGNIGAINRTLSLQNNGASKRTHGIRHIHIGTKDTNRVVKSHGFDVEGCQNCLLVCQRWIVIRWDFGR